MAKKTKLDIIKEERITRPPRLEGKVKNTRTKNAKKMRVQKKTPIKPLQRSKAINLKRLVPL